MASGAGSGAGSDYDVIAALTGSFRSSFQVGSPLAARAIEEDLAACSSSDDEEAVGGHEIENEPGHLMYRRPSGVAYGTARPVFNVAPLEQPVLSAEERKQSRHAEASLLRDNHVLPPKHKHEGKPSIWNRAYNYFFSTKIPVTDEDDQTTAQQRPSETDPLLGSTGSIDSVDDLEGQWDEAIHTGKLRTTWQRETKTISQYSAPLIITFVLQYSVNVVAIVAAGKIGKVELGAVSLANMTAAITCLAPFQGLATSLDTLCAQAYGSGHKHLVGLQFQRMTCFLFVLAIPVAVIWSFSDRILGMIVPEAESARLAGLYLKVMICGVPGFILFEGGKRFTQAQGLFHATTYCLLVAAPFHIVLVWALVYKFELGFIGAPIGVAITDTLLPLLLFLYVKFINGSECWGGFSAKALKNWWIMIRLALPGMIMVEAEWLAFEILTLVSSRFGTEYLAAQSVITTLASISYQFPFPVSIAASTRVANLIGAGLVGAAKTSAKVTFYLTFLIGALNMFVYLGLRYQLPRLFTDDDEVVAIVANVIPVVAFLQIFDGLSAGAHGLLRGVGKQAIGGPANLISYYVVSLPIALWMALVLDFKLSGLWGGVIVGLAVVSIIEYVYLWFTDWDQAANEAAARNAAG